MRFCCFTLSVHAVFKWLGFTGGNGQTLSLDSNPRHSLGPLRGGYVTYHHLMTHGVKVVCLAGGVVAICFETCYIVC